MKKFLLLTLAFIGLVGTVVLAQECFSCACQDDDKWLGFITEVKVTALDDQGRATAVDLYLTLRPGWDGRDINGCCKVWEDVVTQSCVQFGVWGVYFGSDVTGWGWDANHDRTIDESEWMPYNETYWAEWNLYDETDDKYIVIHGIPLNKGVLEGNIFIVTPHGEIIYFIPSELKRCDDYARDDSFGAGEIYINFW
jgi:hypothetical protein